MRAQCLWCKPHCSIVWIHPVHVNGRPGRCRSRDRAPHLGMSRPVILPVLCNVAACFVLPNYPAAGRTMSYYINDRGKEKKTSEHYCCARCWYYSMTQSEQLCP